MKKVATASRKKAAIGIIILAIIIAGSLGYYYYTTVTTPPERTLYLSHWGFSWDAINRVVIAPFEQQNNVKVVLISGTTSNRFTKLSSKAPPIPDLVFLPDYYVVQAASKGLLMKLDLSQIPNYGKLYKTITDQIPSTLAPYGVPYTINDMGLAYRTDTHAKISSWKDLWRSDFKGEVLMPTITATSGPMALVMTSLVYGGTQTNVEPGFEALETLKSSIVTFYSMSSDPQTLFGRGEVQIGPVLRYNWAPLKNLTKPVDIIYPTEGSVYNLNMISMVNGTKNADLGYKLIDFWLSTGIQTGEALAGVDAPVNQEAVSNLPANHPLNVLTVFNNKPTYLDPVNLAKNLASWVDAWKKRIES